MMMRYSIFIIKILIYFIKWIFNTNGPLNRARRCYKTTRGQHGESSPIYGRLQLILAAVRFRTVIRRKQIVAGNAWASEMEENPLRDNNVRTISITLFAPIKFVLLEKEKKLREKMQSAVLLAIFCTN